MMITCQVESLNPVLNELQPLLIQHWRELGLNQDEVPLLPQYDVYFEREARGEMLLVIMRSDAQIVGYFLGFIAPALHYRTCLTLTMDIFWLHPDFRDGDSLNRIQGEMLCMELFETVKTEALRRGVQRVYYGTKSRKDSGALFEAMGMVEVDRYYSQWWGE